MLVWSVRIGKYFPRSQKRPSAFGLGPFLRPWEIFPYTYGSLNRQITYTYFLKHSNDKNNIYYGVIPNYTY